MKKLLYIGHSYHLKTQSTFFLQEILTKKYEVETFCFDPYAVEGEPEHFDIDPFKYFTALQGKTYDILVLFQVMPKMHELKKIIHFKHGVFFPMFDGSGGLPDSFWQQYESFKVINFSKTLHNRLLTLGINSFYIQYFPEPIKFASNGSLSSIFFWQRIANISLNTVEKLLLNIPHEKIHVHKVLDPQQEFTEPSKKMVSKISYSTWYSEKKDMLNDIEQSAIYIAPREYEGIGMSFLEAMAMGRCVIAPDNPTMNEYIQHNKTGILYDSKNVQPLDAFDIRKIQHTTYEYMQTNYDNWKKESKRIPFWLEQPLKTKEEVFKKYKPEKKIQSAKIMKIIPVTIIENEDGKTWRVLRFLPLVIVKNKWIHISFFYLFGFLPLVLKESYNIRKYDLFGFFTLLKVKKIANKDRFFLLGFLPLIR